MSRDSWDMCLLHLVCVGRSEKARFGLSFRLP